MLTYAKIKANRRRFLALTGLTPKEFRVVLPAFAKAYAHRYPSTQTLNGATRQRQAGGGRKSVLNSPEQKLLFALVYLKAYPLQALLGEVFGLSQSRANYWIHRLLPVLQQALDALGVRPARDPRQFACRARQSGESLDFIIDGTERRRQRPKNKAKRDEFYSVHKKTHTDKNVLISHVRTKRIGFLSRTQPGKVHDKKVADTAAIVYPRQTTLYQDTGFQGYAPRGVRILQPKKSRARVR